MYLTRRALLMFIAGLPLAALPAVLGSQWIWIWGAALGVALFFLLLDAALVAPSRAMRVTPTARPEVMHPGEAASLEISVETSWRPRPPRLRGRLVVAGDVLPLAVRQASLKRDSKGVLAFELHATRRGEIVLQTLWLRWKGPFGLAGRQAPFPLDLRLLAVSDARRVRDAANAFLTARNPIGERRAKVPGEGSEFESLREYVPGLDARAIHWKASARHMQTIVREYRSEQDHRVMLVLDTGRLMGEMIGGKPRLDHAIEAALALAWVALKTGDRVGLCAFDESVRKYVAPLRGVSSYRALQRTTAALAYSDAETNFTLGLVEISQRLRRRSLIVVLTDFIDSVTAETMQTSLRRLGRRHLVLFVPLRNPMLDHTSHALPQNLTALYRAVVAEEQIQERDRVLAHLSRAGLLCIDALPSNVSMRLLERYAKIRQRELVG